MIDAGQVKAAAAGRWVDILADLGGVDRDVFSGKHGPCPRCGGRDRFRMLDAEVGGVICNQCFSERNGDGISALQWLKGWTFPEALKQIADYLGITNGKATRPPAVNGNGTMIKAKQAIAFSIDDHVERISDGDNVMLEEWAAAKPPVGVAAIEAVGGVPVLWSKKMHNPYQCVMFPCYRKVGGEPTGAILYRSDGEDFPAIPNGPGLRKTHCLRGSKDGWVIVGGWDGLKAASTVWRVEGVPDALALAAVVPEGHVVVTNIMGAKSAAKCPVGLLKGKHVVIVGDADQPGQVGAERFAGAVKMTAASVGMVTLPFEITETQGRDVRDFLGEGGTFEQLVELTADADDGEPQADPDSGEPLSIKFAEGRTDIANSRRLVKAHGDRIRHCHAWKKWLVFDGKRWAIDNVGYLPRSAKDVSDSLWQESRDSGNAELLQFVMKSASSRSVDAIVKLAASEPGIPVFHTKLDRDPWLLNVANGTVDLRTGELREHRQSDLITKLCPTAYDPDANSYEWDRFLDGVFGGSQDLIDFARRLFGYALTGDVSEQVLPILWGSGSNGKSTLLNAYMNAVGPDYTEQAPPGLLMARHGESHPTELADLFGRRFVSCVETEDGHRLAESMVKQLTGGEKIRARRMREDFWEFDPTHKVFMCSNHKPEVRGNDHAIWRRLALIPFVVTFWNADKGETGPDELKCDKRLPDHLNSEAEGILAWAVRGCMEWQRNGLNMPAEVLAATDDYRSEQDVIETFIADECDVGHPQHFKVRATQIYQSYSKWCETSGEYTLSQRKFGAQLTTRNFERFKNDGVWYRGITLKDNGTNGTF